MAAGDEAVQQSAGEVPEHRFGLGIGAARACPRDLGIEHGVHVAAHRDDRGRDLVHAARHRVTRARSHDEAGLVDRRELVDRRVHADRVEVEHVDARERPQARVDVARHAEVDDELRATFSPCGRGGTSGAVRLGRQRVRIGRRRAGDDDVGEAASAA
jgi:hypothetical protein